MRFLPYRLSEDTPNSHGKILLATQIAIDTSMEKTTNAMK